MGSVYDRPGPYRVKSLEFPDMKDTTRENRPVPLKVYFPLDRTGSPFPLVIMSHGGAGNCDSFTLQAEHLAGYGYVVICPEDVYSSNKRVAYYMSRAGGRLKFREALHKITKDPKAVLERPRDVSFAIDQAVCWNTEHKQMAGMINTAKIGVMGHSFGAYTVLASCGAQPILDYLEPKVGPGKGLAGNLGDPRVTFGFAMSPQSPGTTYFGRSSYKTINKPLVCISGSKDVQKRFDGAAMDPFVRREVLELLPPGNKYFLWLDNADHFSFADHPKGNRFFPSEARKDAQRICKSLMVLFSDFFLKNKTEAAGMLNEKYVNSLCGNVVTKVEWHEK